MAPSLEPGSELHAYAAAWKTWKNTRLLTDHVRCYARLGFKRRGGHGTPLIDEAGSRCRPWSTVPRRRHCRPVPPYRRQVVHHAPHLKAAAPPPFDGQGGPHDDDDPPDRGRDRGRRDASRRAAALRTRAQDRPLRRHGRLLHPRTRDTARSTSGPPTPTPRRAPPACPSGRSMSGWASSASQTPRTARSSRCSASTA